MMPHKKLEVFAKDLRKSIFSSMKIKPKKILREVFSITEKHNCPSFFLIGTNTKKGREFLWGTFYIFPTDKKLSQHIILFDCPHKDGKMIGYVSKISEKKIIVTSLSTGKECLIISKDETESSSGLITTVAEIKGGKQISSGHWDVLMNNFKSIT